MRRSHKFWVTAGMFSLLSGLYFFDNIKGYYRFKQYCAKEGGLRVYEPLEKNVGWWAKDKYDAQFTLSLDNVGFVRYLESSQQYDLQPVGERKILNPESEVRIADLTVSPIYKLEKESYSTVSAYVPGRVTYQVKRISDDRVMLRFNAFYYAFFDSERTPMGVNEKFSCFDETVEAYSRRWKVEINNSFGG